MVGGSFQNNNYFYDHNGNLTKDLNKQIEHISYNALNLPNRIKLAHEEYKYIDYTYLSNGTKLQKRTWANSAPTTTTDYVGSFVFKNCTLDYVLMPEGRIEATANGDFSYNYFLKDHLGNTRIVFSQTGEVLQDESYYPFGMSLGNALSYTQPAAKENNYLYNGKELQTDFGLEWYDYGWRFYDPQLARFHTLDPLAEKYSFQSPFVYGANNPIRFIDFMGMSPDEYQFNSNGQYTGKVEKEGEHYGTIASKDGKEATTFSFADPVNDPNAIDAGEITQVVEVSDDAIASTLDESGVNDQQNQDNKYDFIQTESNATSPDGSGKMDYVITANIEVNGQKQPISSNTLYLTTTESGKVAHNNYNFGNFLWGAGAKSLGIPKFAAKLGAHYNNYFNDPNHKGKLDSKDDQYSISLGYEWKK